MTKSLCKAKKTKCNTKEAFEKTTLFIFNVKHHTKAKMFRVGIFFLPLQSFFAWVHSEQCFSVGAKAKKRGNERKEKYLLVNIWLKNRPLYCVQHINALHTVSFDWFLSGLEWILNFEFCLLKLLIFYQKLLWNIRSRLNSSTFWVFAPAFTYGWTKSSFFVQKASILVNSI